MKHSTHIHHMKCTTHSVDKLSINIYTCESNGLEIAAVDLVKLCLLLLEVSFTLTVCDTPQENMTIHMTSFGSVVGHAHKHTICDKG